MTASNHTPPNGESVSDGGQQTLRTPSALWRCTFCGNVLIRDVRPTKCFQCRRGESERQLNDDRLFAEFSIGELVES